MATSLAHGIFWTFFSRVGAQATQIVFSVFLARILSPEEYGVMGMLMVIVGFAMIIGDAGISSAVIYFDRKDPAFYSTAFWLQVGVNLFFTLVFFFGAPFIAEFYEIPILTPLTQLLSINFLIHSLGQIQNAILAKRTEFKAIAISNYFAALISSALALILALNGAGIWALAWQALANSIVLAVGNTFYSRWWPGLKFDRQTAREMMGYGLYLLSHNVMNYWMRNGDNLLIGKVLGAHPLGIYNRAYSLMLLPLQNIGAIAGQVMFPALSKIKEDKIAFRELYLKSLRQIALIAFPIMAGLSLLSKEILLLLYGPQWNEAAPILQILCIVSLFQCIIFPVGWIFTSLGKTKEQFRLTLWLTPLFFVLVFFGLNWGLLGVTWGYATWAAISGIANIFIAGRLIGVKPLEYLKQIDKKICATLVMALAVGLVHANLPAGLDTFWVVLISVTLGAVVYIAACIALRDEEFFENLRMIGRKAGIARFR